MIELKRKRKNGEGDSAGLVRGGGGAEVGDERGGERSEPLNEGSRKCGKAAYRWVREVAGIPKAAVHR